METVRSADGTIIAYEKSGSGPAIVLVTGAFCDRASSATLAANLPGYTLYRYDRRGRGDSGDTAAYAVRREVEDLAAVIAAADGPAFVFGHSSGAVLALEAAANGVPMAKLAVYEPPYTEGGEPAEPIAAELTRLVSTGHRDHAAEKFLLRTGMPEETVGYVRQSPGWAGMQAIAHTLAYDVLLCGDGFAPTDRLGRISVPTLAMGGGDSPGWGAKAAELVAAAIPGGRALIVEGQNHGVADDVLVPILTEFYR